MHPFTRAIILMKNRIPILILRGTICALFSMSAQATEPLTSLSKVSENSISTPLIHNSLEASQASMNTINKVIADNKLKKLEADLRGTEKVNPDSVNAKLRLAGFLMSQNRTGESIPFFQEAITLTPDNPKLFASLSVAYLHQAEYGMAKAMADEALRLSPEMAQAKKLNEYIEAKQNIIEIAEKTPVSEVIAPNDNLHNKAE